MGEQRTFYKKGKWVLLEKSEDGFVELKTLTTNQQNKIREEIVKNDARIREGLYTYFVRYKYAGTDDTVFDGALLESQEGDGRAGGVHRETSGHDGKRSAEGVREDIRREIKYSLKQRSRCSRKVEFCDKPNKKRGTRPSLVPERVCSLCSQIPQAVCEPSTLAVLAQGRIL